MKKQRKGFSLIEIIVVMAIMTIMTSMFFTVDGPRKKLEIQRESYLVAQNIRRMENMSASIQATPQCAWDPKFVSTESDGIKNGLLPNQGYAVYFQKDTPKQYTLYANCFNPYDNNPNLDPNTTNGKNELFTYRKYNSLKNDPNCSEPVLDLQNSSWYHKKVTGACDLIKIGGAAGNEPKYGDETIEIVNLPNKIKITNLEEFKNNSYQECKALIVGFEPPDPATYIYCCADSQCTMHSEPSIARLTIKQDETDGEERVIEMNKAGLIWVKNK